MDVFVSIFLLVLVCVVKKSTFLTKKIETTTPIPFEQAWSRAYKKAGVVVLIDQGPKKSESEGAENGPFPHTNEVACV